MVAGGVALFKKFVLGKREPPTLTISPFIPHPIFRELPNDPSGASPAKGCIQLCIEHLAHHLGATRMRIGREKSFT